MVNRVEDSLESAKLKKGRDIRTLPSCNLSGSKTSKSIRSQVVEKEDHIEEAE
jgi:hypothetical protein